MIIFFAKFRCIYLAVFLILTSTHLVDGQTKFPKPKYKARSNGVPAAPYQLKLRQPDGSNLNAYLKGDGAVHWHQTIDGYTILKGSGGYYEYAVSDTKGNLKSSGVKANNESQRKPGEIDILKKTKKGLSFSPNQAKTLKSSYQKASSNGLSKAFPTSGTRNLLVILIDFPDRPHTFPSENFDNLMNQQGYNGTGSFRDFYLENSFGQLDVTSTVVGWYTASNNHDYYCDECPGANTNVTYKELVRDAVDAAEASGIDFSVYDNDGDGTVDGVMVIHQGEGAERGDPRNIWSHSSSLGSLSVSYDGVFINDYTLNPETANGFMGTIGVLCHEFGHNLGLPDFYDTDYAGSGGQSFDLGNWDCMAGGAHNNGGATPANHNSYSRNMLGWQTALELTLPTTVTLNNTVQINESYFYTTPTPNEYFWLENRQALPGTFDEFIPGHGMLIYHIDLNHEGWQNNTINVNPLHNAMDIEEADNIRSSGTLVGDPFPGSANATSFTDLTVVNSNTWLIEQTNKPITSIRENNGIITFDFMGGDANIPENFIASAISSSQIDLSWNLNANNNPVIIAWSEDGIFGNPLNGASYANGSSIPGGGSVIYSGSSSSTQHNTLSSNTTYYYRIWSNINNNYSSGITATATTLCDVINSFPYREDFENGVIPSCWSENGSPAWQFINGNGLSNPSNAQSGSYNACLKDFSTATNRNKLITPAFNLTDVYSPVLTFWYTLEQRSFYSDQLRVYYKTSSEDYWHLLETFTNRTVGWTMETINLPNISSEYYIAFEGDALAGSGVCIDNISIEGCEPPLEQAKDIDFAKEGNNLTVMWSRGSGDSVLVLAKAGNAVDRFPIRGINYYANSKFGSGSQLGSGNYVIYNGSDTSVTITNIYSNVNYHLAVFEYNSSSLCYTTPPLIGKNNLTCLSLVAPLTVDFEIGFPDCWSQEEASTVWQSLEGNGLSNPNEARGGTLNICLKDNSSSSNTNKLISSPINVTTVSNPTLKFWHTQQSQAGNQDVLRVFYKTSKNDTWHLLAEYTNNIIEWTMETIVLPNPSETYYLAFEGNAKGGHGVCIDDISISVGCEAPSAQASDFSISGLENGNSILHWNNGSGYNTLIVAKLESQVDAYPLDGRAYYNTTNYIFGQGAKIGDNNCVLYQGYLVADTTKQIYGLYANHDYNFAIFSFNPSTYCYLTPPLEVDIRTPKCNTVEVPYSINIGSIPPSCWSTDAGSPAWGYADYNGYEGGYSAYLRDNTTTDDKKMLISPPFDLTTMPDPNIVFWHTQRKGYSYGTQDELRVYYKTSANGEWNLLATYLDNISNWTREQLVLPDPSSEYYIGFEGNAKGGYGVWLDDISIEDICIPPTAQASNFYASNITGNSMRIEWTRGDGDSVLVIGRASYSVYARPEIYTTYEANNTFGLGQELGGGNYVIYNGSGNYIEINGLTSGIEYYFAIYEYNNASKCYLLTNPLRGNVSTICPIVTFPFVEDFEGAKISTCWSQEIDVVLWTVNAYINTYTPHPHNGRYYAAFSPNGSSRIFKTKLVSPKLDLTSVSNPTLEFWRIQKIGSSQEKLLIYYKTSATGTWNLLSTYTDNKIGWTREQINLPEPSNDYYIAFEGNVDYGDIYLDDIKVYSKCQASSIQASDFRASNITKNTMTIEWTRGDGDRVLVFAKADSPVNEFPLDGTIYNANAQYGAGQEIGTGNFVVYNGDGNSFDITGLSPNINYYFDLFEYNSSSQCYLDPPLCENVSTHCISIPYFEDFEPGTNQYFCWTQEEGLPHWDILADWNSANNNYAAFSESSSQFKRKKYISPAINLTSVSNPTLKFWHLQPVSVPYYYIDNLRIYYKTSATGSWNLLATYMYNDGYGGTEVIELPNPSDDYYIAFEGETQYGPGVYIDDISIYSGCTPPSIQASDFSASNVTINSMTIGWTRGEGDSVLVIARIGSPVDSYPSIETSYTANAVYATGQEIGSGNFVVYNGSGNSINITELSPGTTYHFAIFEYNDPSQCYLLNPLLGSASTHCSSTFPYSESFEDGTLPTCWSQEEGPPVWQFIRGNGGSSPANAHTGFKNACLRDYDQVSTKNKLISPSFNLSSILNPKLEFWHTQKLQASYQDELKVYYKTSTSDPWILLESYTYNIKDWKMETINLPSPSSDYYIAFEGDVRYGLGICIDDIRIYSGCFSPSTQASNFIESDFTDISMTIEWMRGNGDSVLVIAQAETPVDEFPMDGTSYDASSSFGSGQEIGIGNFVVYNGTGSSVNIIGLNQGINYYYAIYEYFNSPQCYLTPSLKGNVIIPCPSKSIPFFESFEGGTIPACWVQEAGPPGWLIRKGNGFYNPNIAHEGLYNACLVDNSSTSDRIKLITPPLDLALVSNPTLKFWHTQQFTTAGQDELRVYFKTSDAGQWNLLATYTDNISNWNMETINLPNPSSKYYIAFEGDAKFGFGVCLDDISVTPGGDFPSIMEIISDSRCGNGTLNLGASSSSGIINWYAVIEGGTPVGTGTSFSTPTLTETTTYYVEATDNGCTTPTRTAVTATINEVPTIIGTTDNSRCGAGTVVLGATASMGEINWYSTQTGGVSIGTGTNFTTPTLTETTTYYVEATDNGCTTPTRTAVTATINEVPTITGSTNNSGCGAGKVALAATANKGEINWYLTQTGGVSIGTGTNFTTATLTETTTYYVAAIYNGCATPTRTVVIATINEVPTITGKTDNSGCAEGTVALVATANIGEINWYLTQTGGVSLGTGANFTTPILTETTTYYVAAIYNGCATPTRTAVTATINEVPTITGTTNNSGCARGAVALVATANIGEINWYLTQTGGVSVGTGTNFTTPILTETTTYYVAPIYNGCDTPTRTPVTATINEVPTITGTTDNSGCAGGAVALVATANIGEINWYLTQTGGVSVGTGTNFTTPILTETTTYYVASIYNGCATPTRTPVTATINEVPTITGTTDNSHCGEGAVTIGATASEGIVNWSSDLEGNTILATGTSFTTPTLTETTTYYAGATNNGCTTQARAMVSATIKPYPDKAPLPYGNTELCVNPDFQTYTIDYSDNATNYIWQMLPLTAGTINGSGISATTDFDNSFIGTVKIFVFGENDCGLGESSDSLDVIISSCTAIEDIDIENLVKIYPNPSNGKISIRFPDNNTISYFEVIGQSGKVILVKKVSKSIEQIELKISGTYNFRFYKNGKVFSKKVIIRD